MISAENLTTADLININASIDQNTFTQRASTNLPPKIHVLNKMKLKQSANSGATGLIIGNSNI